MFHVLCFMFCEKMRILFFDHNFLPAGEGEGSTSFYLLREYAKNPEFEIDLMTVSTDGQDHLLKMGENVTIHCLAIGKKQVKASNLSVLEMFSYASRAYKFSLELMAEGNVFEIAHAFTSFPDGLICQLLSRKKKVPYLISAENQDAGMVGNPLLKYFVFRVWKNSSFLIVDNQNLRGFLAKVSVAKEIGLLKKGVDLDFFSPAATKQETGQFVILCDSQIVPIKGIRFLIQAFKILASRYENLQLSIVGEGNEKESLHDLARSLDVVDKIVFLGELPLGEKVTHYQQADVFVLPSQDQQVDNGVAIRRALAVGLPVVATPVFGTQDLVADGVNGFSVRINVANDLVEKIEQLILDKNLKLVMGKNSLQLAQKLSWQNIAQQYLELYIKTKNISRIQRG